MLVVCRSPQDQPCRLSCIRTSNHFYIVEDMNKIELFIMLWCIKDENVQIRQSKDLNAEARQVVVTCTWRTIGVASPSRTPRHSASAAHVLG